MPHYRAAVYRNEISVVATSQKQPVRRMNINYGQGNDGALRSSEEDWNFNKGTLMVNLGTNSRRLLSSGGFGIMDAVKGWTFVFSLFALVYAGALSERASAVFSSRYCA